MSSVFDKFTNQYTLNKTLRFELKPIGKTEENIKKKEIIGSQWRDDKNTAFGEDAKRAENYKIMKQMLDEVHRKFIEEALSQENLKEKFTDDDIKECYEVWGKRKGDQKEWQKQQNQKLLEWQKQQKELAQKLGEVFDEVDKKWRNKVPRGTYKNENKLLVVSDNVFRVLKKLINEDQIEIQKDNDGKGLYSKKELEEIWDYFTKFHTYFKGFRKNRENIYHPGSGTKLISTSIAHRLFENNLPFHFQNIQKWETVKKSVGENNEYSFKQEILKIERLFNEQNTQFRLDEFFEPSSFLKYFSQSGIDEYNQILGGPPGQQKQQGLNEVINETRQKANANRKAFPPMQELYKQILSKDDKRFIDVFGSDKEMLEAIKEFHRKTQDERNLLEQLQDDAKDHLDSLGRDDLENHQVSREKVRRISKDICLEWDTLDSWWNKYVDEEVKQKNERKKRYRQKTMSFAEMETMFRYIIKEQGQSSIKKEWQAIEPQNLFKEYIKQKLNKLIKGEHQINETLTELGIKKAWEKLSEEKVLNLSALDKKRKDEKDEGYRQVALIKDFLDACLNLSGFIRSLQVKEKDLKNRQQNEEWQQILTTFSDKFDVMNLYNKVRNRITKKPYSLEKIKVNFQNQLLLSGWAKSKESAHAGILFEKNGLFYLGIMDEQHKSIFDYDENGKDEQKKRYEEISEVGRNGFYRKMIYEQAKAGAKIQKLMFINGEVKEMKEKEWREKHLPPDIYQIGKEKSYENRDDLAKFVDYYKKCAKEYWKLANFDFKDSGKYKTFKEFTDDVDRQVYSIKFDDISTDYINKKVEKGELYLFQIYNKDFSSEKKSKGKDNLHTLYWKSLFEEKNLSNVVTKLDGGAEIFFRPASIKYTEEERQKGHHSENPKKKFNYPILKDRRYSQDKYLFHVPIALNPWPITLNHGKSQSVKLDQKINEFLKDNPEINIIGIDRGEKHLLYYSVINQDGKILKQGSLNTITTYKADNSEVEVNYHRKLDEKEKERGQARKNWSSIENIKELKAGYLSQVVHKLAQLIIDHNAIVVLEDLNTGFKRRRLKVEKQVYQKFEKAIIDKLNYLVFKDANEDKAGHYLRGYQLTAPFKSFEKLGKQTGILFYTSAGYTSTTDPVTGFLRNVYYNYTNVEDAQEFWRSFDSIKFNEKENRFEFTYTIGKVKSRVKSQSNKENNEDKVKKKTWLVCSCVIRSRYIKEEKKSKICNLHEELKKLFGDKNIDYEDGECIKEKLAGNGEMDFHEPLIRYFNAILNIRVTDDSKEKGSSENDYILSPVEPFFDSRKSNEELPKNGDANGAYNIARKGILILENIEKLKSKSVTVSKWDWQNYAQSDEVYERQKKKYQK